jgi:hypothetical protein
MRNYYNYCCSGSVNQASDNDDSDAEDQEGRKSDLSQE